MFLQKIKLIEEIWNRTESLTYEGISDRGKWLALAEYGKVLIVNTVEELEEMLKIVEKLENKKKDLFE